MTEKKDILIYVSNKNRWVCPECETENSMTEAYCVMCKCKKPDRRPNEPKPNEDKTHYERVEKKEESVEKKDNRKIWIIIILALLFFVLTKLAGEATYSYALNAFKTARYETAMTFFNLLPENYKDVSIMRKEAQYQRALELLNNSKHSEARELFVKLNGYGNSKEKLMECDYVNAILLKENKEYIKAMEAFHTLGEYKDSRTQFAFTESMLIDHNRTNGYFADDMAMIGRWSDYDGNYVEYSNAGGTDVNVSYNLKSDVSGFFKVKNGVHYHGSDKNGWTEQWIFDKIDDFTVELYDYVDGKVYTLSK